MVLRKRNHLGLTRDDGGLAESLRATDRGLAGSFRGTDLDSPDLSAARTWTRRSFGLAGTIRKAASWAACAGGERVALGGNRPTLASRATMVG